MSYLNVFICTFNCGRKKVNASTFARHLSNALSKPQTPDLVVVSLQEVAPIAYSFLGGSYLIPYLDSIRHAVQLAASSIDATYINIVTQNVGMTVILAFILKEQVECLRWLRTAGVGVGLHEMGNKGAVGLRIGYSIGDEILELSLVSAHLAAMEEGLKRRNEDWKSIVQRLVFTLEDQSLIAHPPRSHANNGADDNAPLLSRSAALSSGIFTPTSHLIFAGDLNYRTSELKPTPSDFPKYPQPTDDRSHPSHYSNLLKDDQLCREMKGGRTCHGLQEAAVDFPPTYKYSDKARTLADAGDELGWAWARHRWPSWCDRILYLDMPSWMGTQDSMHVNFYTILPLMATSDHRPVALSLSIPLTPIPGPFPEETAESDVRTHPPFEIDGQWRAKRTIARRKELAVGAAAYLLLTWEGNFLVVAILLGALGGWTVVRNSVGT